MAKKEDKKPATKTAQCFVCMRPTQIPVDSPKGMVVCDSCYASTMKEFNDKKKKKP